MTGKVRNYGRLLEPDYGADAGTALSVFNQISMALEKDPSSSPSTVIRGLSANLPGTSNPVNMLGTLASPTLTLPSPYAIDAFHAQEC
jgi:hypothetical protein